MLKTRVGHRDKAQSAARLKQIWVQPDRESALKLAALFIEEYEEQYPEAIEILRQGPQGFALVLQLRGLRCEEDLLDDHAGASALRSTTSVPGGGDLPQRKGLYPACDLLSYRVL